LFVGIAILVILVVASACSQPSQSPLLYAVETPTPGSVKVGLHDSNAPCTLRFDMGHWYSYGNYALVTFKWTEQAGVDTYDLQFSSNAGFDQHVQSNDTSYVADMAGLPEGNFFMATVSATNEDGILCSDTFKFIRPSMGHGPQGVECTLKFLSPSQDGIIFPTTGEFYFKWSGQDHTEKYVLTIDFPGNAQVTYDPTVTPEKKIYLENLEAEGTYVATITAYDGNNAAICSAQVSFYKHGYHIVSAKSKTKSNEDSPAPTEQSSFIPIIVLHFTPTPVVIK